MQHELVKDSGFSWVICFGSSIVYFLEAGALKSLGVLLPALRSEFSTQTWEIGLLVSLVPGYGSFACLMAGAARKRFSSRVVMIVCGLLTSSGLIMASCSSSIPTMAVSFILTGFSLGAEGTGIAVLHDYFDKYYDAANAIAHVGMSMGVMVMPLLAQFLLDVYGWRGTLLLIGGLNFHTVACGAVLRPTVQTNESDNPEVPKERQCFKMTDIIHMLDLKLFTNLTFVSFVCMDFAKGYFYTSWLIYLVPHSLDTGFQPYQASALASVGGCGYLVGSFAFLLVMDKVPPLKLLFLTMLVPSVSFAIDPILTAAHAYVGLMLASFAMNFACALNACVLYSALGDFVSEERYFNAVNYIFASYAIGSVASGFFTGWLFDAYGNYTMSYLVLSAVVMISLIPLTIVIIKDYMKQRVYQSVSSDDSE